MELHWLSVLQRVHFKLETVSFNTIHTKEPEYLYDLLRLHEPVRSYEHFDHRTADYSAVAELVLS